MVERIGAALGREYGGEILLLRHAFDALQCVRVQFTTDELNEKSRAAILRIGAKEEGVVLLLLL